MMPGTAFAQGGPGMGHGAGRGGGVGGGRGNGGGGGQGEEAIANNLSVPAIFVPSTTGAPALNFACGVPADPAGTPQTGFTVAGYYYLQGVDKWQASCATAADNTVSVTAVWGDNLTGAASLRTGSPIRVEVGLLAASPESLAMTGYNVVKLEPSELDRVSPYGTEAASGAVNAVPAAKSTPYLDPATGAYEVRVWDAGATLKIYNKATGAVVFDGPATAEVNSTGRVVYGYNLRVESAGTYVIEFTAPTVTISSAAPGRVSGHTASLEISVGTGGGGGQGHRGGA